MKIMLAVDGSPHSDLAEKILCRLAGNRPHEIEVLYVTPIVQPGPAGRVTITQALYESGKEMADAVVSELGKKTKFKVKSVVLESNDVADAIIKEAHKQKADMVVMGARGLTPLKTFFLGSVSQRVSRHAETSVLIARSPLKSGDINVLVAVDGSLSSRRAVDMLKNMGIPKTARVLLAHVIQDPLVMWETEPGFVGTYGSVAAAHKSSLDIQRRRGKELLRKTKAGITSWFSRVEAIQSEGYVAGEIIRLAKNKKTDLIVMGRRGLSRLDRFFLGSVSHKVSSYSPCSVLIAQ